MNDATPRLIEMRADNFKRLKAVRIKIDGRVTRIEGRNAQGKSAVLGAIAFGLGGARFAPADPVRHGAKRSEIILDLTTMQVRRIVSTSGSTTLEVTSKGAPLRSPQAVLDALRSDLTFDPLAFQRMAPKQQGEQLRRMLGIDFCGLDRRRAEAFEQRTQIGRDLRSAEAAAKADEQAARLVPDDAVAVDAAAIAAELSSANAANTRRGEVERRLARLESDEAALAANVESARRQAEAAQQLLQQAETKLSESQAATRPIVPQLIDTAPIIARLADVDHANAAVRLRDEWKRMSAKAAELDDRYGALSRQIEAIDAEKDSTIAGAKMPLPGLSIDAHGDLILGGVPFADAAQSEQLRASVAVGLAERKPLRLMLIDNGESLDSAGMAALEALAEEYDATVIVSRVADPGSAVGIVIEDGEVVGEEEEGDGQ